MHEASDRARRAKAERAAPTDPHLVNNRRYQYGG